MDKLKFIKTIVFIITFLLVFGTLVLLGTIFKKTRSTNQPLPQMSNLEEPFGSKIDNFLEKDGVLHIQISQGGIAPRIVVFDTKSGKKLSTISLY